ncbi:Chloramphenicol acetyltransferase-like domain protein [Niveomyces insectorum RCEF 264]|uniref:Chloramphenicol acetyltransferase-like domain protein n=1 Tax=Niveomyces insectorum RCEF 264 TaxID=1081102 RepID=A0A167QGV6_9HYPO|nr:Chloramphenicol acetyltransferase-like domain protein [Niveomyces insectorum RCEF 264]
MDVIPIPLTNQHKPVPNIRTRTFFIARDRLNAAALRSGLDTLIREHWRKLGARVAPNPQTGFLEYHLPHTFPDNYELFKWSTEEKHESLDKAAPSMAAPSGDGVAFLPPMREFDAAVRPSDWPYHLADDPADSPLLYVHVALYDDASILVLSLPHVVGDQLGTASIIKAWLGVLRGETPPPLLDDPLPNEKQYADYPKHEVQVKGKQRVRRTGERFLVILGFIPDFVFYKEEIHHTVFFPRSLVTSLRQRATKELAAKYGEKVPAVSDGDIVTAILAKFSLMHRTSSKMISLSQSVNVRGRIPKLSGPERDGFIHNGLIHASSRFELAPDTPVSEIAYQNRVGIQQILEPGSVEKALAIIREMVRRKQPNHTCEPFEGSYHVVSWIAAWKDLDFSSAVEQPGKEDSKRDKLFVLGQSGEFGTPHRFHSTIMARNDEGYWIDAGFSKRTFTAIQKYLAEDPKLEKL